MVGFEPVWSKRGFGLWSYGLGLACLGLLSMGVLAVAAPLFAGVSSIEAGAVQADGTQPLRLTADLPFQYQTQIQDADHVILRIYNARLAKELLTPEGSVNLLAGGAVQSARLRQPKVSQAVDSDYQELILSGPGLGKQPLKITGAEALPLPVAIVSDELSSQSVLRPTPAKKSITAVKSSEIPKLTGASVSESSKPPGNGSAFGRSVAQPVAMMATVDDQSVEQSVKQSPSGPQITSVRTLAGPTPRVATVSPAPMLVDVPADEPVGAAVAWNVSTVAQPTQMNGSVESSEPVYQVLTPLPRYQGGAAPIRAMTTDADGKPILLRPKNQAIPEFSMPNADEPYNVLFHAESENTSQLVARLMAESLKAFQAKQYSKALPPIQQALALDSDNADLYAALAEIQLQLHQTVAAQQAYAKAWQRQPVLYGQRYAQALVLSGQRQKAIQVLKALYEKNPHQAGLTYTLGTLYEELGQTSEALPYLKQAAELNPGSADVQYNLGLAYELSGDSLLAERHYQKALRLNSSASDVQKALARIRGEVTQ